MIYDIIVIGGGPAGMTAAIKAKETAPSASVKLIDKNKKLGKKLYATGNGKCNIANTKLDLSCYSSANEFFPFQFVTTDSHNDVMDFFESLGVSSYDDNGYIYPASSQASTIVWALTDRLKILGIENSTSEEVLSIKQGKDGTYIVDTDKGGYRTTQVILAPGGAAAPKLGGSDRVYRLLDDLNVRFVKPHPALCKLKCHEYISDMSGVRAKAVVRLMCDGEEYDHERGEVQFASGYLSGIAVFNMSIQCIDLMETGKKPYIELELVPDISDDMLADRMRRFAEVNGRRRVEAMLNGIVNEKIAGYIIKSLGIKASEAAGLDAADITSICDMLKHMRFNIDGFGSYEDSQAASGGVDTLQLRADNLELAGHRGLYAAGEYVDVTGKCGGYNIMWAVISGMRAGESAGKRIKDDQN